MLQVFGKAEGLAYLSTIKEAAGEVAALDISGAASHRIELVIEIVNDGFQLGACEIAFLVMLFDHLQIEPIGSRLFTCRRMSELLRILQLPGQPCTC